MKNLRLVFLSSGGGGNLRFVNEYLEEVYNRKVVGVIADRNCDAIIYAKENNIYNNIQNFDRSAEADISLIREIKSLSPDIIVTTINKILSEKFVEQFRNSLINLHYSYLPSYEGLINMKGVDLALDRNNSFIGTTVHYVTKEVDSGNTVAQGIFCSREANNIYNNVFQLGALTLLSAIMHECSYKMLNKKIINDFIISPYPKVLDYNICRTIFDRI